MLAFQKWVSFDVNSLILVNIFNLFEKRQQFLKNFSSIKSNQEIKKVSKIPLMSPPAQKAFPPAAFIITIFIELSFSHS